MADNWVPSWRGKGLERTVESDLDRLYKKVRLLEHQMARTGGAPLVPVVNGTGRNGGGTQSLALPIAQDPISSGPAQPFPIPLVITPSMSASVSSINASSSIPGSAFTGGPITTSGTLILALTSALLFRTAIGAAPLIPTVTAHATGPVTLTAADSFQILTNFGALASVTYNLPAAASTGFFIFVRDANFDVVIQTNGADTIQDGGSVTSAGGTATLSAVGSTLWVTALRAGAWFGLASEGLNTFA